MTESVPEQARSSFQIPSDPEKVEALDEYLVDMIGAIKDACNAGQRQIDNDNLDLADQSIQDGTEFLAEIMKGKVEEWIE